MSDASTKKLIDAYMEEAEAPGFLSSMATRSHFYNTKTVEIDIERDDEEIAIVLTDMAAGARKNERTLLTNKEFEPPPFKEEATLNGFEMLARQPGQHAYIEPSYQANAISRAFSVFRRMERKIRRSVELMWAQALQTGVLNLTDASGAVLYKLDFGMRDAHRPTAASPWSGSRESESPLTDIDNLAQVIRRDGKRSPNQLVFGRVAWQNFFHNRYLHELLDKQHLKIGEIAANARRDLGAAFQGQITIGTNTYDLYVYDVEYKDPVSGVMTPYVAEDNVLIKHSASRLDMSWGNYPLLARPEDAVMPYLPRRMSSASAGLDLITNAYRQLDGSGVTIGAYARPLPIPVAIDTLGCLKTEA